MRTPLSGPPSVVLALLAVLAAGARFAQAQPAVAPANLGWGDGPGSAGTAEGVWLYWEFRAVPNSGTYYRYRLKEQGGDFGDWIIRGDAASLGGDRLAIELVDDELENHATYTVELQASTGAGAGPAASMTFTPKWPNPPRNVLVTPGDGRLTVTWEPPEENSCAVLGYQGGITYPGGGGGPLTSEEVFTGTQVTVTGLTNGARYGIYVVATAGYDPPCLDGNYAGDGPVDSGQANAPIVTATPVAGGSGFSDDPIARGVTPIKAVHVMELRDRIDALRTGSGLGRWAWTDPQIMPGVTPVRAGHVAELQAALAGAYVQCGQPRPAYTERVDIPADLGLTTPIRALHVNELRRAVEAHDAGGPCGRHELTLVDVRFDRVEGPNAAGYLTWWVTATVRNSGTSPLDADDVPPLWPRFYDGNGRLFRGVSRGILSNTGQTWGPGEVRTGSGSQGIHADRVGDIDHFRIDSGSGRFGRPPVGCVGCGRRFTDLPR